MPRVSIQESALICSDDKQYTVAKMQLMSTNFRRTDGKFVWIGHNVLATKVIENSECLSPAVLPGIIAEDSAACLADRKTRPLG